MSTPAVVVRVDDSVAGARDLAIEHRHGAYPAVTADGALVGIVDRDVLLDAADDPTLADLVITSAPTVGPDDTLDTVAARIVDDGIDHVTVIDDETRVLGMCTRADVLAAQTTRRDAERRTPGRLPLRPWRRPAA
jgi:CBS domain-containing protein